MRDFKVHSLTILHYGKDYLSVALKSAYSNMDRQFIFYTPHASHGHRSDAPPIESKQELIDSLADYPKSKLIWEDTDQFWHEGQQRDYALSVASHEADLVLVQDYDEIWFPHVLNDVLEHVWRENKARRWLLNFRHLWRSFNYIIEDDAWPVRVIDTRHADGIAYIPRELTAYHFGYAVTDAVMRYKWQCHGHKDELRPDWFTEKWQAWPPVEDCHPTNGRKENGEGWWNPKPFDKWMLPSVMCDHPFFNLERID